MSEERFSWNSPEVKKMVDYFSSKFSPEEIREFVLEIQAQKLDNPSTSTSKTLR